MRKGRKSKGLLRSRAELEICFPSFHMSLNFVASSVLTVSDGVHAEKEEIITNSEVDGVRRKANASGELERGKG